MNPPQCHKESCTFQVWAPTHDAVGLRLTAGVIAMAKDAYGYFRADVAGVGAGTRYQYMLNDVPYPDPASAFLPEGVYGPSEVVDHDAFVWTDAAWHVPPFAGLIFYELHVGTFTPEGSFDAIIPRLGELAALGVNAIELMPVAACSGERNWGYDGTFLYAVTSSYGGPEGLKRLVDASHAQGIAVFLDVVYNHIGREGNCLEAFGPYFTGQYQTPWGKAINYDGPWSDGVRDFIIGNVLYWAEQYHIDGLRLDAIHEIYDRNAVSIWDELYTAVREWEQASGRRCYLIAESDTNDPRVVRPPEIGGRGFDAQWMDDFHHSLYVLLHPEGWKNYKDFGSVEQLAKAWTEGFVHTGEYVFFRHRRHGASPVGIGGDHFIVFNQNHDLPGNRPGGERLSVLVGFDTLRLAAAVVLLSPYVPLLFMGEEYGEDAPFYFFSDYQEPATTAGLLEGRRQQFANFGFEGAARDPQDESLFLESKLRWEKRSFGDHRRLLDWHRELIALRRSNPLLADLSKRRLRVDVVGPAGLAVYRHLVHGDQHLVCLFNFSHDTPLSFTLGYPLASGSVWRRVLAAGDVPDTVVAGGMVELPVQGVAVYEFNLLQGSPAPAAK